MDNRSLFQGSQQCKTLLAQRQEIAADTAESHSIGKQAKTARDLLAGPSTCADHALPSSFVAPRSTAAAR